MKEKSGDLFPPCCCRDTARGSGSAPICIEFLLFVLSAVKSSKSRRRSAISAEAIRVNVTECTAPERFWTCIWTASPGQSLPRRRSWILSSVTSTPSTARMMSPFSSWSEFQAGPPTRRLSTMHPRKTPSQKLKTTISNSVNVLAIQLSCMK